MHPSLTSGVTGAAPIWNKLMNAVLDKRVPVAFTKPSDIADGMVDGHRDLVLSGQTTKSVIGQGKKKIKDEKDNSKEKEVITFTDPFSTFQSDSNSQIPVSP